MEQYRYKVLWCDTCGKPFLATKLNYPLPKKVDRIWDTCQGCKIIELEILIAQSGDPSDPGND